MPYNRRRTGGGDRGISGRKSSHVVIQKEKTDTDKLFEAVESNNVDQVGDLLSAGAFVDARDRYGRSPLYIAVEKGLGEITRLLLKHGADINLESLNRRTAMDIARDSDLGGIYKMLYGVETTMWKPGDDPDLLLIERENALVDQKDRDMAVIEKSQIQDILEGEGLSDYFPIFEQHKISFLDFIRVDEDTLIKLGITDKEHRVKIVALVKEMADRKWQNGINLPVFMRKDLTSFEITCILNNLSAHAKNMRQGLDFAMTKINKKPEILRLDLEAFSMENICAEIDRVEKQTKCLIDSVNEFSSTVVNGPSSKGDAKLVLKIAVAVGTSVVVSLLSCGAVLLLKSRK